ncbi:MAG: GGDEF domain-containing protein [archaeon]
MPHKIYNRLKEGLKKVSIGIGPDCHKKVKHILDDIESHLGFLYEMVINDPKTGVYNNKFFEEITSIEIEKAKRGHALALIISDIDNFKRVNDIFGHKKGDAILKYVVKMIRENTRKIDVIGRFGGEEFTVLLPFTDYPKANMVAERIRKKIESSKYLQRHKVTVSIGLSTYEEKDTIQKLFNKADSALYYAKNHGKNMTVMHKDLKE